jgi:dienelactone hydrolase
LRKICFFWAVLALACVPGGAAEVYDGGALPMEKGLKDLAFPTAPQPFGKAKGPKLFKPDGPGPFPGLVLLPTCGGHSNWYPLFDWAKAALERGYAVMVVDPLTPRGVGTENCKVPLKAGATRFRKDGFDAAEHLRKQPFVDRDRVALLGQSLGAMAALSASGEAHATPDGRPPFRAIVSLYPICNIPNYRSFVLKRVVDMRFVPGKVVVPLQVQMGELDTEASPKQCVPLLDEQKSKGAPVEFIVHKNATHSWDTAALGRGTFTKPAPPWAKGAGQIVYRYNPEAAAAAMKLAFDFLDRHMKKGG